jgi:hypothetical protein
MFEFLLKADSITNESANLNISDISDWSLADNPRNSFGVFVLAAYRESATEEDATVNQYDPLLDTTYSLQTPEDGRYSIGAVAFYKRDEVVPSIGDVHVYTDGLLYEWDGAAWNLVNLEDVLDKAYYTSELLEIPFLAYSYTYKNKLNLDYIRQVKNEIGNGAEQNKLYYKRTNLDYVTALINGAEYNWALSLFGNYYDTVRNLKSIINSEEIS